MTASRACGEDCGHGGMCCLNARVPHTLHICCSFGCACHLSERYVAARTASAWNASGTAPAGDAADHSPTPSASSSSTQIGGGVTGGGSGVEGVLE